MLARPIRLPLALVGATLLLAACSSTGPAPEALDDTTPDGAETTLVATTTPDLPLSLPSAANIGVDGVTLEEARARVASKGALKPADLSFALMDEATYKDLVEPRTGPAAIKAQGGFDRTGDSAQRFAGLSSVIGFTRDWTSADSSYTLREEITLLGSDSEASSYADRLRDELTPLKIPQVTTSAPNVVYAVEFGIKELDPKRQCVSIAIARRGRLVTLATFSHACTTFSGTWSALLSSYALERSAKVLGL